MTKQQRETWEHLPGVVRAETGVKVRVISASALHLTLEYLNPNDAARFAYLAGTTGKITFDKEEA